MPPWYALPVLHVGFSSICWHLFWSNWGQKFHSIYPESITLHPARLAPQLRISIASTGLKYQNLMEYDCMRDSSKTLEKQRFPAIFHIVIPEHFTSNEKKIKNFFRFIFWKYFWLLRRFFWYTMPFVEYEDLWVYVECDGVLWSAMTPLGAMLHEYARREIPWEKDSGPQFPKFNNRADAGCCSLTRFQPTQSTNKSYNILKPSPTSFSKMGNSPIRARFSSSRLRSISGTTQGIDMVPNNFQIELKGLPTTTSQFTGVKHVTHRETGWENKERLRPRYEVRIVPLFQNGFLPLALHRAKGYRVTWRYCLLCLA